MKNGKRIETVRTDLVTLLGTLANRLRNDGLTLTGIASKEFQPVDEEFRDYDELAASLERTAALMEAIKKHLCQKCKLMQVVEQVTVREKQT